MNNNINMQHTYYLTLSFNYFNTAKNILNMTIDSNNPWIINSKKEDYSFLEYVKDTKWSDFIVLVPTLFLYFHGIELLLKGMISLNGGEIKKTHEIEELIEIANACENNDKSYIEIISMQLSDNILISLFCKNNGIEKKFSDIYMALRYPFLRNDKHIDYLPIQHKEKKSLNDFKKIITDIDKIEKICVSNYNKILGLT